MFFGVQGRYYAYRNLGELGRCKVKPDSLFSSHGTKSYAVLLRKQTLSIEADAKRALLQWEEMASKSIHDEVAAPWPFQSLTWFGPLNSVMALETSAPFEQVNLL